MSEEEEEVIDITIEVVRCPMCCNYFDLMEDSYTEELQPPYLAYWFLGRLALFRQYTMTHCPVCSTSVTMWRG